MNKNDQRINPNNQGINMNSQNAYKIHRVYTSIAGRGGLRPPRPPELVCVGYILYACWWSLLCNHVIILMCSCWFMICLFWFMFDLCLIVLIIYLILFDCVFDLICDLLRICCQVFNVTWFGCVWRLKHIHICMLCAIFRSPPLIDHHSHDQTGFGYG